MAASAPRRRLAKVPVYPENMKAQLIEADVLVSVNLDAAGKVTRVRIDRGSPHPEFNEAARAAAETELFEPAIENGVAIPFSLSFTYRFRLETPAGSR